MGKLLVKMPAGWARRHISKIRSMQAWYDQKTGSVAVDSQGTPWVRGSLFATNTYYPTVDPSEIWADVGFGGDILQETFGHDGAGLQATSVGPTTRPGSAGLWKDCRRFARHLA